MDGGYYLKTLPALRNDIDDSDPRQVADSIGQLISGHLRQINEVYGYPNPERLLYRCFFYDAWPYENKAHRPISKTPLDYSKSDVAQFRNKLFGLLRYEPNFALRMGDVIRPGNSSWILKEEAQRRLLRGRFRYQTFRTRISSPTYARKGWICVLAST